MVKKTKKKTTVKPRKITKNVPIVRSIGNTMVPASYGTIQGRRSTMPEISRRGGRCLVRNYELVTAFPTGNAGFQNAGGFANPGLAINFPWLSTIAVGFQKFRWTYLRYFFSGSCSTSTSGKVWLNLSYDALDSVPNSLAQAMQSEDSSTGPAWFGGAVCDEKAFDKNLSGDSNIYVDYEPSRAAQPYYYVRTSNTDVALSLTGTPTGGLGSLALAGATYDTTSIPVHLYYGNNGVTNGTVPGELYVAYIVELFEPVAPADNN